MKFKNFYALMMLLATATLAIAQKPKSQKEVEALMAIQNAQNPDARIAAVDSLVTKFADTEFKSWALERAAEASQQKNDGPKAIAYAERTLEADPKSFEARLLIAGELARGTREFDLDKEEKLARSEKLAKEAIALLPAAPKPNAQIPDDSWAAAKKDYIAQGHEALGMIAMVRKKYDVAVAEFKLSVDGAATPNLGDSVRLGAAYTQAGQPDEAIVALDKVINAPNASPVFKQAAEAEKKKATDAKSSKK